MKKAAAIRQLGGGAMSEATMGIMLRALKLTSFEACHEEVAQRAERDGWSFSKCLQHLVELELNDRKERKIQTLRKKSRLPLDKMLSTLDQERLPSKVKRQLPALCEGGFVDRAENVLAFGLPGRGKTHLVCAIGHELIRCGRSVLFIPSYRLVQRLLVAKKELTLETALKALDHYDVVILDDLGYVQQDRGEMEVLLPS